MRASRALGLLCSLCAVEVVADTTESARLQYQVFASRIDSAGQLLSGLPRTPEDQFLRMRYMSETVQDSIDYVMHYQLERRHGDRISALRSDEDEQLFDLDNLIDDEQDDVSYHRLDRLYVGSTHEHFSWKAGRYAVSWGNGLVYHPFDIFNPFSPDAIDTEYKPGIDMLYMQTLLDNGDDIQLLLVPRRDINTGNIESDASSLAVKYHGLKSNTDFDLLLASHYDDTVVGIGFASDIEGWLWRADLTWTDTSNDAYTAMVTNLSYSWTWQQHPMSGFVELYANTIGLDFDDGYDIASSNATPALQRLSRGELFTLGRRYLAVGMDIETHPLRHLLPTLFWNLDDGSAMLQALFSYDLAPDMQLLGGVNLRGGQVGSEFGSSDPSSTPGLLIISGQSVFVQFNLYL